MFMGLFQTGAKMLGLAEGVKRDPVHKIVVPGEESARGGSRHKVSTYVHTVEYELTVYVILCYAISCYMTSCHVYCMILCHATLCHVML